MTARPLADLLETQLDALVDRWRARLREAGDLEARLGPAVEERGRLYLQSLVAALRGGDVEHRTARFFFGSREGARPASDDELAASAVAVALLEECVDERVEGHPVRLRDVRRLGALLHGDVLDLREGPAAVARGDGLAVDPTAVADPQRLFQHFRWHDITGPRRAEELLAFVAEASRMLASSLDQEQTLRTLTEIAVPAMADCCSIEMLVAPRETKILAIKHVDPRKVDVIHQIYRDYPTPFDAPGGAPHIIRTGTSALIEDIPPELFKLVSKDEEHLRLNLSLGVKSSLGVPILARGEVFGAMVLMCSESNRRLGRVDLALAEELGRRAGLAVANARLYAEAQQAIRLRDDFITVASHELRTPLHAAQLQLGALIHATESGTAPRPPLDRLRKLEAQLDRIGRLTERFLDATRIREGGLELSRHAVDLGQIARDVVDRFGELAARAGCAIGVRVEGDATGQWDPERLDQVASNLLQNAIKFGAGAPIDVIVDGTGEEEVALRVVDRGMGLHEADQERIFERFERAVSVRSFGGVGLGLWIVKQVVVAHGGTLLVESTPGEGSTFGVVLPRRGPEEDLS